MARTLYELANVESPFVWRNKFALAHKGLAYNSHRTAFTDIPNVCGGRHKTVPILVDEDGTESSDSLAISTYLDHTYPDAPSLLGDELGARAEEIGTLIGAGFQNFFPLYIKDICDGLPEKDAAYFRSTREARFNATIEDLCVNRESRLPQARKALDPLREALGDAPWFAGQTPAHADYIVLAFFAWLKGCATTPPLDAGDMLVDYIQRGFALYGGIGEAIEGGPIAS